MLLFLFLILLGPKLRIKKLKLRILWSSLRLLDDTRKIPSPLPQIDFRLIHSLS